MKKYSILTLLIFIEQIKIVLIFTNLKMSGSISSSRIKKKKNRGEDIELMKEKERKI